MKTACAVGDLPQFKSAFETWTSLGLDIHDLDSVMIQAVRQDQNDVVVELLHKELSINQDYVLEAIKHRSKKCSQHSTTTLMKY